MSFSVMALKLSPIPFPIFLPNPNPNPSHHQHYRPATEVRFSRWNNANAREFEERRRTQEEIETDIRRLRRFTAINNIVENYDPATANNGNGNGNCTQTFKSVGTPSVPSKPSIPGKKSKYSKPDPRMKNNHRHPAFRSRFQITKIPQSTTIAATDNDKTTNEDEKITEINRKADIKVSEDGVSYVIDGAPFEFMYSYTETPKVRPLKLREAPYAPFGPTTMPRPWTGRAPLPASKKKQKEFDSFVLPPPHKKGVKPVQKPGPYLPGSGPRYVKTREEILGEPLTEEEVEEMIEGCKKSNRQLNMGRDGFTHNMLENIHAHWKRRRVCKIKCRGVCTVDMNNVCQQLEEKTGGKVIFRRGGVLYLFRGRNYNYKTRPRFPLMLWRPITPVYPRLIKRVPEGLTLKEAIEMRAKGRKLIPIRKLGKNGVYANLVKNVREAFEECELVRINCQGMKGSDYHKIGAKLKDLVPCVLISFEHEHILMWRGKDWKSFFTKPVSGCKDTKGSYIDSVISAAPAVDEQEVEMHSVKDASLSTRNMSTSLTESEEEGEDISAVEIDEPYVDTGSSTADLFESKTASDDVGGFAFDETKPMSNTCGSEAMLDNADHANQMPTTALVGSDTTLESARSVEKLQDVPESSHKVDETESMNNECDSEAVLDSSGHANQMVTATLVGSEIKLERFRSVEKLQDVPKDPHKFDEPAKSIVPYAEEVLQLWNQAVESGSAVILTDANLDADTIYQRAVTFGQSAPAGPIFRHKTKKVLVQELKEQQSGDLEDNQEKELATISLRGSEKKGSKILRRMKKFNEQINEQHLDPVPQGSLRVDELAKLLA